MEANEWRGRTDKGDHCAEDDKVRRSCGCDTEYSADNERCVPCDATSGHKEGEVGEVRMAVDARLQKFARLRGKKE